MVKRLMIGEGPGSKPEPDKIRIDIVPEWADICCDIRKGIPVDDEFEYIEAHHVLEHIQLNEDFIYVMRELHQHLKEGGTLSIRVPHKDSDMAYESIEHTRFFTENSFMNFYNNPYAKEMNYPLFKLIRVWIEFQDGHKVVCVQLTK